MYVSYIKQFWSTAKIKTVNNVRQIRIKVNGKATIVLSESSVRRDPQFDDEDGIVCLTKTKIFENLQLMGYEKLSEKLTVYKPYFSPQWKYLIHTTLQCLSLKSTAWNEFEPITVPSSSQPKKTHRPRKAKRATEISQSSGPISLVADESVTKEREDRIKRAATTASSLEAEQDSEAQTRFETASKQSNDPPLSRVNTLGSEKDRLKLKELMDLCTKQSDRVLDWSITKMHQAIIGTSSRRSLGKEDASKQGRNLKQVKQIFKESDFDDEGFDAYMDEVFKDVKGDAEQVISAAADEVPTGTEVNIASAPVTTVGVSMRSEKSKVRGSGIMQEPSENSYKLIVTTPTINNMILKTKEKMQVELEKEERLTIEREEVTNIAKWDNAQAIMDAYYELAARIQAHEQEELAIEEKSRLFVELMDNKKKHFARLRAEEQRRKPLTKAQKRINVTLSEKHSRNSLTIS
ncbi:hypothetical protein Tco_1555773 [Tanacetum coccineum]